ncbi:prolow-density lipoprotein receptor-related protein 1-like isoform X2 [Homarus americanus]|uniref:prolow-density lipoprotein receptor-related protein 1-like isoform X2 n=1 Tax=Homarus americanus TaxID=6706 RepID=UPI001C45A659|nr:prolow-density lipoprotein receptor-related protein 1-like isoform X2 [Homarus americanus]
MKCIPKIWRCDYSPDCLDASDEPPNCPEAPCGTFRCNVTGKCLPQGWVCDGEADCGAGDTSDEDNPACKKGNTCPLNYFRCKNDINCILLKHLCDDSKDCPDSSDEGDFCYDTSSCQALDCKYGCKPTEKGPQCFCSEGQQPNGTSCVDANECQVEGSCDQLCTNLENGFECGCTEGYKLEGKSNCKAVNSPPDQPATLLYASNSGLARLYLNGSVVPGNTHLSSQYAVTVDFDHRNNSICWVSSNNPWSVFQCASTDNFDDVWTIPPPTQNGLLYVHDIARDWVTGNWYILDRREMIFMCNATMKVCITLMDVVLNEPRGIALDPSTGYMFFSNWGTTEPKLERALMDGNQRQAIVITKIVYPFGVTLDYPNKHVYWVDGYLSHVERVDYSGENRRIIIKLKTDERPYGISLFENFLYVTSWKDNSIKQINRFSRHYISTFHTNLTEPMHVHVFHRQRQPHVDHPCGIHNGGCQHICIPLWKDGQPVTACHCQPGHILGPGGSCVAHEHEAFLIYAKGRPGMIKGVALDEVGTSEVMVPITSLTRPTTLDYDVRSQFIYYADIQRFVIERQSIDGIKREPVVTSAVLNVEGLAVDWMGRNIYWTDEGVSSIFVCSMKNPEKRKMLLHGNLTNARAIVLNPGEGYMYWTVWHFIMGSGIGGGFGLIERAWMDGTHREPFVTQDLQWPNGLTIDFKKRHLYWCDGFYNKIERIGLDGRIRKVMLSGDVLSHPYGLAYYNGYIYWSEFQNGTIKRVNLDSEETPKELRMENPYIFDLKVFSNTSQSDTNACTTGALQCIDLCLATPNGPICACATGYEPDIQQTNLCNPITNFTQPSLCSDGQFQCKKNLRCIDERYLCDGDNDCLDNSDEDTLPGGICEAAQCHKDMFQCGNNQCIDAYWVCDGDRDCEDGSDESPDQCNHPLCPSDKFRCQESGRCIAHSWVCDIDKDCGPGDDSDEHAACEYQECDREDFKCGNKRCVPTFYVCDGDDDCRDGTDERSCDLFCANATATGLPTSPLCNNNCLNITQQETCQETQGCTHCGTNNTCIAVYQLCDGVEDCPDGSDETRCEDKILQGCSSDEFMCVRTRECIPQSLKCDGSADCLDQSDELDCESINCSHSEWKCATLKQCIPDVWRCDGEEDCNDGSDEKMCPSTPIKCPAPGHICDNNTLCIQPENLCDDQKHCKDGSDEGGRCKYFECELMDCQKNCTQGPGGPVCTCPKGQTLLPDGRLCSSLHPCEQWGTCSQECVPTKHSHKCVCIKGYQIEQDHFTCKSTDSAIPYLIFSNRHELRSIMLKDGLGVKALISALKNTIALDFYHSDDGDVIFWTDVVDDKIYRGTLLAGALSNIEVVVQTGLATAEGLAVDWLAENLYWVESNLDQIEVAKLNGSYRRTLVAAQMESPRAISLDPRVGMMFWTDWEEGKSRIESCSMSGEGRRIVIMVSEINGGGGWPNGLTLDYALRRIYWIDAKSDSIHTSFYDGSDHREILREHHLLSHPFSISLFGNYVYWTDWRTNSVIRANKFNGSDVRDIHRTITQPFDIQVLHPSRQPRDVPNPCKEDNGGCSHLCLLSFNGTHQCNCPHIMSLGSDNKTCIRNAKVLLFSRPNEIRGVDLNKPSHDIIPRISLPKVQHASQLDFEAKSKKIYWADLNLNEVKRASLTGAPIETVMDTALQAPRGFAIDWLSKNLFVTSNADKSKQINVATINGEFMIPIITENILDPLSLAVDPYGGRIFWSDIGGKYHTVHMASMTGSNVTLLSSQEHNVYLHHPRSLAFDASSQRLYWVNLGSDSIQYYDMLNDNSLHLLETGNSTKPEALTVYMNDVYYTDASDSSIYKVDKNTGSNRELVRSGLQNFLSLKIYDEAIQDGSNACSQDSPPCAHLCLPKNRVERECRCAVGYKVDEGDPTTCVGVDGVLIFSNNVGLSGIDVNTPFTESGEYLELLTPISEIGTATRLDFHASQDLLVWADGDRGTITSIQRDGTNRRVIVEGANTIQGIAVDWVANNLYWTNPQADVIEMCRLNGSDHFVIIASDLEKPGAITLYPGGGYMFWADTGNNVRIERATLDGANRTVLVNTSLQFPSDLVVDFEEGYLYWVDQRAKTLERVYLDGSEREMLLDSSSLQLPVATFVFNNNIYWADMVSGGGSVRSTSKTDLSRISTLRSGIGDTVKDIIIMSNDVQIGINPCANNNGGCAEICLYNGIRARCQCYHARVAKDGKACEDYDAFLMFSSITGIDSIHMFDENNPNTPLKKITSDFMKNAISLTFDFVNKRLYYSDIQRGSINTVHFNGSNHAILVERQGSVEGLAFEEKERDLYWTCQSDATINRMSVDMTRTQRVEKIVHLDPSDKPRGIVVDSCDLQIYWTNWNSEAPSIQRSLVSGIRVESIITTQIKMPNGLAIDHKAQKLYWGDARLDKIERCNLDGSERLVLLKNVPSHPFDLAIYGDYLFWTDWVLHAVVRANKHTAEDIVKLRTGVTRLMGIVAVANDTNACDASPCRVLNGGCEDICTLDEWAQVICRCSPGRMLLGDGRRCAVRVANCTSDQFECSSGFCIPYIYSCDGVPECPDGSDEDEKYCVSRTCREGYFTCGNGPCVPQETVCDRNANCPNFKDENDCECRDDEIRCETSGLCIASYLKCDNDPDCPDASDEMGCEKPDCTAVVWDGFNSSELINCVNTTNCIHPKWICDGANDCWDNSDEQNCTTITVPVETSLCPSGTHQCRNGRCIATSFICDGDNDCKDGNITTPSSDEASCNYTCPSDQFTCADGNCIPSIWLCDAHKDCIDGSDEPDNCETKKCEDDQFKCNTTGRCIPQKWVCDGDNDCGEGAADENPPDGCPLPVGISCPPGQFICPLFNQYEHRCLPAEYHCDGHEDCWDGSDEPESCPPLVCLDSQFKCNTGQCIPSVWVCNGRIDCSDSSDEANCTANVTTLGDGGCPEGKFSCNNGLCVDFSRLCNFQNDCGDFSDEHLCNINECNQTRAVCAHKCIDKKIGYACECNEGFAIDPKDSKLCEDINECADFPCPHICHNTLGSYKCICATGYISEQDGHKCRANSTVKPKLIFTNRYYIREINIDGTNSRLLVANLTNAVGLDYDFVENCIYWSDVTHLSSSVKKMCNNSQPIVLHSAAQSPDGIALDWVGRNLYWCDKGKDTIEVCKLDGQYRKVLIDKGLQDPRAIVLDPFHGNMFWTDWGNQPHIGKAGMDGSHQRIIVNSSLGWPNALTISYATNELFWADAHQDYIAHSDLEGKNIRIISDRDTAPKHVQHIFAITVFEDYLYWTDWELKSVLRSKKYSGKDTQNIYNAVHSPMDIHIYHPFRQQPLANNPCENNGGCDTMCLLAPDGGKTCTCPENFLLSEDGVSCHSNCLNSMFVCESTYKCIPFWWKCDTQDDCGDKSDEPPDCREYTCTPGQFQCNNTNCIHPSLICDNQDHCKDGSDEPNCDEYHCVLSQFKCPAYNGSRAFCIAGSRQCDRTPDCPGGFDEQDCPPPSCSADWFSCNNTKCIPKVWVCDGEQDCPDNSDEMAECSTRLCPQENFRCNNGRCIPRSWKCDGEFDCPGREDEGDDCYQTHSCDVSQFKCDNMKCIPVRWKCDGENDCLDGSDEEGCPVRNCSESEFRCDDGRCIAKKYHCDGSPNCADSSDETKCDVNCENMFKCETPPHCILKDWVCDKDPDCSDESDERNCSSTCAPESTRCNDGGCVYNAWMCDGENDCNDGSDESKEFCANHSCAGGRFRCKNDKCILDGYVCDGEDQCGDGSDESPELCQMKKVCKQDLFQCKNGRCIDKVNVCDSFDDCIDNSDEQNCPMGCRFGECSQICNVKKDGNHTCSCSPGYSLQSYSQKNQKSCFADGNLAYMVLANYNHLRKLSPYKHGNSASILTLTEEDSKTMRINSVDVLYGKNPRAFWTNLHDNTLVSMPVPTTHEQDSSRVRREAVPVTIVLKDLKKPRGVAVDWVTELVYVINGGERTIMAVSVDGSKKVTLISTDIDQIQDIVVDPKSGQMFWSEWGFTPAINVAAMDGHDRKRLLDRNILEPLGLAIDYTTRRLYWADVKTHTIETVKLDGSDRQPVKHFETGEGTPSSLDVFEDMVYFITHDTRSVYRMNKFGFRNHEISRISQHPMKISDVLIIQEQKQDRTLYNPCASSPCDPDAMCLISGPKNYSCICPDGMTEDSLGGVKKCHIQPAKTSQCPLFCNKGVCEQTRKGPRCKCDPLYQGLHCEKYRCSGYCKNDGYCSPVNENGQELPQLRCYCTHEWTGERCESPVKTCQNFCQNGGECHLTPESIPYCTCNNKFTGERCEQCKELHCENGGTCRSGVHNGNSYLSCSCAGGFHGSTCSYSVCTSYCKHGTCSILQDRPHCTCNIGWSGKMCDNCTDRAVCEDLCGNFECENEGKCTIFPGPPRQARCSCAPGYHGTHCEMSVCQDYCHHGYCEIRMGVPICECDRGWTSSRCDIPSCQKGDPNCGCPKGYHGHNCEHRVCDNYCVKGSCHLDGEAPICKCPPGYTGERCDHYKCDHYCHRGSCRITADEAVCDCEDGYTGPHCTVPISTSGVCSPNYCENGGSCVMLNGRERCKCSLEYTGDRCQTHSRADDNLCANINCLHDGICQMSFGRATCLCSQEWTGENCGLRVGCDEEWCLNGGICSIDPDHNVQPICKCREGYSGPRCESPETLMADKVENSSPNAATVIIGVFVAIVVLVVAVVVAWVWQRQRGKGISHVRLEENGGTVEMTNPVYMHASDDQEDDPNPVFTLHDSPNTFKNPVYDSLYSEEAAASTLQEEKTGLLLSDPLGALDTNLPTGSKS